MTTGKARPQRNQKTQTQRKREKKTQPMYKQNNNTI